MELGDLLVEDWKGQERESKFKQSMKSRSKRNVARRVRSCGSNWMNVKGITTDAPDIATSTPNLLIIILID